MLSRITEAPPSGGLVRWAACAQAARTSPSTMNSVTPSRRPLAHCWASTPEPAARIFSVASVASAGSMTSMGRQPAIRLPRPGDGGLEHERERELGQHGRQVFDAVDPYRPGDVDAQLVRDLQRAVLVGGDLERGIRRQREHAAQRAELVPVRHQGGDDAVTGRQYDPGRVFADELEHRRREHAGIGGVARQHHVAGRVARLKGQDGQRRIALHEALGQSDAQPGPAQAAGAGQALLVAGVEDQNVVAARMRPPGCQWLALSPRLRAPGSWAPESRPPSYQASQPRRRRYTGEISMEL